MGISISMSVLPAFRFTFSMVSDTTNYVYKTVFYFLLFGLLQCRPGHGSLCGLLSNAFSAVYACMH